MKDFVFSIIWFLLPLSLFSQNSESRYIELFFQDGFQEIIHNYKEIRSANIEEYSYYWTAKVYQYLNETDSSNLTLKEGIYKYPSSTRLFTLLIDNLYEQGRYKQALIWINKYEETSIITTNIYKKKIAILESQEKYQIALKELLVSFYKDSLNRYTLVHLGDNYLKLDSIKKANKFYSDAYKLDSNDFSTTKKYIYTLNKVNPKKVLPLAYNIIKNDSTNIFGWKSLANSLYKIRNWDSAMYAYNKLLSLGDSSISTLKKASILKCSSGEFRATIPILKKAIYIDTTSTELYYYYGLALANSTLIDSSFNYFKKALTLLQPDTLLISRIYSDIALTYRMLKDADNSLKYYDLAYSTNKNHFEYIYIKGTIFDRDLDNKTEALRYYSDFLNIAENQSSNNTEFNFERLGLIEYAKVRIREIKEDLFFE